MRSDALPPARNDQQINLVKVLGIFALALCLPWFSACTAANSAMTPSAAPTPQPRTPAQRLPRTTHLTITATLPVGSVGSPYSAAVDASGGKGAYTFSLSWGSLPQGLSLDAATGNIAGTPTKSGTFGFGIHVVDSNGLAGASPLQITISNASDVAVALTPATTTVVSAGTVQFTAVVSNTSNVGVTWTTSNGAINTSGMYKAPNVTKNTQVTVTATSVADPSK